MSKQLSATLEHFARAEGCDSFAVLLAAFQTLLARYTNTTDVVVGSTVSNRDRVELENLVGKFDNLIALRADLSGDPTFAGLLAAFAKRLRRRWPIAMFPSKKLSKPCGRRATEVTRRFSR